MVKGIRRAYSQLVLQVQLRVPSYVQTGIYNGGKRGRNEGEM